MVLQVDCFYTLWTIGEERLSPRMAFLVPWPSDFTFSVHGYGVAGATQAANEAINVLQDTIVAANSTMSNAVAFISRVQNSGISSLRQFVQFLNSTHMIALANVFHEIDSVQATLTHFSDMVDSFVTSEVITIINDLSDVLNLVFSPVTDLANFLAYVMQGALL